MARGRPTYSLVRERLAEMLFVAGKLTAYNAHKHYINIFGNVTRRNIYYQLQKGASLGKFKKKVVEEKGDYSWGSTSRKVYYSIGNVKPDFNAFIRDYFKQKEVIE